MKAIRRSVQKGFTIQANWKYGPRITAWEELWRRILSDLVQDTTKHTSGSQSDEEKADD